MSKTKDIDIKVAYLQEKFDDFLRKNNCYEAWYERYRLDNIIYQDEVPINEFFAARIKAGRDDVHNMFYTGIYATVFCTTSTERIINREKQCQILSNSELSEIDGKWMDTWEEFINKDLLWKK